MTYNRDSFDWTDERCEQLRELRASGLSAAKIGVVMGISRNSAIGKITRMHLPMRDLAAAVRRQSRRSKPIPPTPLPLHAEPVPVGGVRMVDLEFWHCRWPSWGRDGAPAGFPHCGQPKSGGGAYCDKHHRLAHSAGTLSERRACAGVERARLPDTRASTRKGPSSPRDYSGGAK